MNDESESATCPLCVAITRDDSTGTTVAVHDTILHRSRNFVIVPALGPLIAGHIMVTAAAHELSLRDSADNVIAEYERVASAIRLSTIYADAVEVEHGPKSEHHHAGSCIAHTHVHWLPQLPQLAHAIHDTLEGLGFAWRIASPRDLPTIETEYVWVRTSVWSRAYAVSHLPSQFVRRVVASHTANDEWDWAAFPKEDIVRETIKIWESHLQNLSIPTQ